MSLLDELIQYSNDIISGKIIACQKNKWACMRFLNDLKRQGTKDFPYVFNEDKANRFLDWMRLFKHTKGVLAGQYINPMINQKFDYGNIFGWVHEDTGFRRFKMSYKQLSRKNAKSQELALCGLYETFADGESASEVYCAATKTDQAKKVWDEAKLMITRCDDMKGKYNIAYGKIEHPKSASFMKALSKEDGKNGDGGNVQLGIIDEYHQHATSEMLDMLSSGKNARNQPLIMIITTAGYDLNAPCYSVEYRYTSQILDPNSPIKNDKYYVMIQELDKGDDIKDENNWLKSNPILCSYEKGREGIRDDLTAALAAPEKMKVFLTKDMNVWIQQRESGYMNMQKWSECKKDFTLADFEGEECIGGLDLSTKLDLTSIALEFKKDGEYYGFQHSFMPDETYQKRLKDGRYPYDVWVQEGNLTVTPGAVIDYAFVKKWIEDNKELYNLVIKEVVYDPYNATQFVQEMEQDGYIMVECRQGPYTLNEPTKDLRDNVYNNTFHHNGDGVLTFAMGNAVTKLHAQEFVMLDKAKSVEKIDPAAALIDAHYRGMVVLGETEDIFYSPDM